MKSRKILIVEDEGILAKGLEHILKKNGYAVAGVAGTGEEAVALAAETSPDLVLMDIRLRGEMDGIHAAERIRADSDTPVIFLTAFADQVTLQRAKVTAPHGYLVKPFDEKLLLITIQMALYRSEAEKTIRETLEELRRVNKEVDFQKRFFESLFRSIPSAALVVDSENRVRAANPMLRTMFGMDGTQALGMLTGEALCCSGSQGEGKPCGGGACNETCSVRRSILEGLAGNSVHKVKASFKTGKADAPGDLQLLVSAAGVEFDGEKLCVLILEDVTELTTLRQILRSSSVYAGIVGSDDSMQEVFASIREVADSTVPVLIQGESGTGKELVALAIHGQGARARKHFVAVNCGALPDGLLESELFGHVKGAFTGAIRDKKGRFELADGGTLFLDEIGELSLPMQVKLLRVLQAGAFERVGGEQTIRVDVRLITATNKDLHKEVAAGRFRGDLYYRLCVMPIHLPPLRQRRGDIPLLAEHLLQRITRERGIKETTLSGEALELLLGYSWPGNVRELENALQYALLKSRGGRIGPEHLPPSVHAAAPAQPAARHYRKLRQGDVIEALKTAGGNKVKAAQLLGVSRATLYRFLEDLEEATLDGTNA